MMDLTVRTRATDTGVRHIPVIDDDSELTGMVSIRCTNALASRQRNCRAVPAKITVGVSDSGRSCCSIVSCIHCRCGAVTLRERSKTRSGTLAAPGRNV